MNTIPITYGEFYDVPRMIQFQLEGDWYFMRSFFDEDKDGYSDFYDVYLLPFHSDDELNSNPNYWRELDKAHHLGRIPIHEIGLDATRRKSINADAIEKWLSAQVEKDFRQRVEAGLKDADEGRTMSTEELRRELGMDR
jgi:hypothetical protein